MGSRSPTALLAKLELYSLLALQMAADQIPVKARELAVSTTTITVTLDLQNECPSCVSSGSRVVLRNRYTLR
jgi:hypothetical protein